SSSSSTSNIDFLDPASLVSRGTPAVTRCPFGSLPFGNSAKCAQMDDESRVSDVGSSDNSLDTQAEGYKEKEEMQPRSGVWAHFDK
ncbi:hypothetical protein HAX54_020093, partial [Datura stramonium]|nr:hypothetical protein [Datura stramonium]